jgi:pyruvate carboxylase
MKKGDHMITRILIANRGEVAIRIARAAADLGIETVAVFSTDDANSLHTRTADLVVALAGSGAAAYLDVEHIITVAKNVKCDAIHPGYGFLSENISLAERCREENLAFIGTTPELLALFGDKLCARAFAQRCNVPVLPATSAATTLEEARAFMAELGTSAAVMVKAVCGGGGRGMRPVRNISDLDEAFARCQSEARSAFGNGDVYVEQLLYHPRHVEVQVVDDGSRAIHLGERDCTMQRRHQKIIEITPFPTLIPHLRDKISAAALRLAEDS